MADSNNSGQFGNRDDTEEQARKGGQASTGSFGDKNGADPSEAGAKGAANQSTEDKAKGGRNSHNSNRDDEQTDNET
jgi:general stress protein YciG